MTSGVDAVRLRPGMYVGDVDDGSGLAHMVWEVVGNALDEHLAGHCTRIAITIAPDGAISVLDDGRGMRVDAVTHTLSGGEVHTLPFAELALTTLHTTPTLDGHAPHEHLGARGVGLCVVNVLSAWLHLETHRDGRRWEQRFARGVPTSPLVDCGPTTERGTRLTFLPDAAILPDTGVDVVRVVARLRELACLFPNATWELDDRRVLRFHEPRGIAALVARAAGPDLLELTQRVDDVSVEVALGWAPLASAAIASYANAFRTTAGGTHERGLVDGLVDGLRAAAPDATRGVSRDHLRRAACADLQAVVCVRLIDPEYGEPTASRLDTPVVALIVRAVVAPAVAAWLGARPATLHAILARIPAPRAP